MKRADSIEVRKSYGRSQRQRALPRRLTAVLIADAVGYGRQMGRAEEETHRRISALLDQSFPAAVQSHHGQVVKLTGDGLIASFPSILDAVHCAVYIQRHAALCPPMSTGEKIEFRIGLHVGDVIVDRDEFYGDCVNIAVRIESVADPGGICLSRAIYDQVHGKVPYEFQSLGRLRLKNVIDPPEIFRLIRVNGNAEKAGLTTRPHAPPTVFGVQKTRKPLIGVCPLDAPMDHCEVHEAAGALTRELCAILEGSGWFGVRRLDKLPSVTDRRPVVWQEADQAPIPLYRIEGHVSAKPGRIRAVMQLLDTITGLQLWAGIFVLRTDRLTESREQVALQAAAEIEAKVQRHERDRHSAMDPADLDLYGLTQLAYSHYYNRSLSENEVALQQFDEILHASPAFASALAGKAACHFWAVQQGWSDDFEHALRKSRELASRAVAADPRLPWARLVLAQSELFLGRHDSAIAAARHATALNPSNPCSLACLGHALTAAGRARPAIQALKSAFALAPYHPNRFMWLSNLALAEYHLHRFDRALNTASEASQLNPGHWLANQVQIASLSRLGRIEEAKFRVQQVDRRQGRDGIANRLPYKAPSDLKYVVEALCAAGWTASPD